MGGYAIFGPRRLLAQVLQLNLSTSTQLKTETEWRVVSMAGNGGHGGPPHLKSRGYRKDQVDSAGNTTGSDQPFGWREEIDCADDTRKGGHQ
jgi:hypothetical protein